MQKFELHHTHAIAESHNNMCVRKIARSASAHLATAAKYLLNKTKQTKKNTNRFSKTCAKTAFSKFNRIICIYLQKTP